MHWSQRVRHRFPDGQLFLNLRGFAAQPALEPLDALTHLLHALGVAATDIPRDEADASGLYRTLMAGRRMLVVLDDARDADQIRPLLTGAGACLTVITSRDPLTGLVAREGARRVVRDVLAPHESRALLVRLLGEKRAGGEPSAVTELARACAHLPLALRIAGAHLLTRSKSSISAYLDELRSVGPLGSRSPMSPPPRCCTETTRPPAHPTAPHGSVTRRSSWRCGR